MFKKIVALLLGLQFVTFAAGATTTYKICGLPDALTVADTDHFLLSRNCTGSYNATGSELSRYFLSKAPGSAGQILFNSGGSFAAGTASAVKSLLGLSTSASTGSYSDLINKPVLSLVATSNSYLDLSNKPSIPAAQVASDWSAVSGVAAILNKPSIPSDTGQLTNGAAFVTAATAPVRSVNGQTGAISLIIPAAQVNSDWSASSGTAVILNKPVFAAVATSGSYLDLSNRPTIPSAQVNSDWGASSGVSQILNKPVLATVAISGSYTDLINKPSIPAAQVNADWNASSGAAQILNKPSFGSLAALSTINNTFWSGTALAVANGGTGATTQGAAQAALGLTPGSNVQVYSAELTSAAAIATTGFVQRTGTATWSASSTIPYSAVTGTPTLGSLASLSGVNNTNWTGSALSIANGGTGASTQAAAQTALGIVPGTTVESESSTLDNLVSGATTVNGHPLTSSVTLTKADVGLSNVENTALSTWAAVVLQITSGSSNTIASFTRSRTTVAWNSASGAPKTQNFPGCTSALAGYYLTVKDEYGDSMNNAITLVPSSGTVDGFSSISLSYINKPSITLECDGVSNWMGV